MVEPAAESHRYIVKFSDSLSPVVHADNFRESLRIRLKILTEAQIIGHD
jgi:hypothetical protein